MSDLRTRAIRLASRHPVGSPVRTGLLRLLTAGTYKDYLDKLPKGKKPMEQKPWEAQFGKGKGKKDEGKRDKSKKDEGDEKDKGKKDTDGGNAKTVKTFYDDYKSVPSVASRLKSMGEGQAKKFDTLMDRVSKEDSFDAMKEILDAEAKKAEAKPHYQWPGKDGRKQRQSVLDLLNFVKYDLREHLEEHGGKKAHLRNSLVRLAHSNPGPLRDALLPLLTAHR